MRRMNHQKSRATRVFVGAQHAAPQLPFISFAPPLQSSPVPSNIPPPSPSAPARTLPTPRRVFPVHSASHPQNSTLHMHTLLRCPTSPHNSGASASPLPPSSHVPQNSHNQTSPAGPWARASFQSEGGHPDSFHTGSVMA